MPDATFAYPDLTTFTRLDELGLEVTGQRLEPGRVVLACRVVEPDQWCRRCGCEGAARDTTTRELAHEPFGWRPTTLLVRIRRYRCTGCGHVWRQDTSWAALLRGKRPSTALFERAAARCADAALPISDVRGTAEHRRRIVQVLARRALERAAARASTEPPVS